MTIKAVVDGQVRTLATSLTYAEDQMMGSYAAPVLLYLDGQRTNVEDIRGEYDAAHARKLLIDGILYIIRDGHIYTAQGAMVK